MRCLRDDAPLLVAPTPLPFMHLSIVDMLLVYLTLLLTAVLSLLFCLNHQDGVSNTCPSLFAVLVCMLCS